MNIDPSAPIAGLRPSALKKVFGRQRFSSDTFARMTKLQPAKTEAALAELARLEWIERDLGTDDVWNTTLNGNRLASSPMLKRLSVEKAQLIIPRIVQVVEKINSDSGFYWVLPKVVLFGSMLGGGHYGTVGDIDIGYQLALRESSEPRQTELWEQDIATRPANWRYPDAFWPTVRITRLLKVSPYVSLHTFDEIDRGGFPYEPLVDFDHG